MKYRFLNYCLFAATLLSGFYGGFGFFTLMGGNPAISKLSDRAFAEYWQSIDSFMGARMPLFGPLLLSCVLISVVLLFRHKFKNAAWLMLAALLVLVSDAFYTLQVNHPYNQRIQSWNLDDLPGYVALIQVKVVAAFNYRMLLMMASFVLVLLSVWVKNKKESQYAERYKGVALEAFA